MTMAAPLPGAPCGRTPPGDRKRSRPLSPADRALRFEGSFADVLARIDDPPWWEGGTGEAPVLRQDAEAGEVYR